MKDNTLMVINETMTEREKFLLRQVLNQLRQSEARRLEEKYRSNGDLNNLPIDYKDVDDTVFANLDLTKAEVQQIFNFTEDFVYVASAVKDDYSDTSNEDIPWVLNDAN